MTVVHFLLRANTGGIEVLCKDYTSRSKNRNIVICFWSGGCIADEMKQRGVEVIELNANKRQVYSIFRRINKLCVKEKVDAIVVHHESPLLHMLAAVLKTLHPKIKTVAYAHCNAEDMYTVHYRENGAIKKKKPKLRKLVLRLSLNHASNVVAISESVSDSIQKVFGVKKEKISVIYNGVDLNSFINNSSFDSSKGLRIIYVGRLIEEKGVQITLKGLAKMPQSIPWRFTVVGDGPYREQLESIASDLGISNNVEFLGICRNIPELLANANIFVHLPIWEEGFGITIVEAMASGRICICADNGAVSELIEDGVSGFLIEKDNSRALIDKLVALYSDKSQENLNQMRFNAIKAAKRFSIENYVKNFDALVRQ